MKRTVIILTGIATLGVAAYIGSRLYAQEQGQIQQANAVAPAPRTKIAVLNLMSVVKQYRKWEDFEKNYRGALKKFDEEFESRKRQALQLKADIEKPGTDEATKAKLQEQLKALDRQVQDMGDDYKRQLAKYRDDMSVQIYREIEDAVTAYARSHDIELVMHFNDAVVPADIYHPLNIQRKLQTAACMPVYHAPGMDISSQIAQMLNDRLSNLAVPAPMK